MEEGWEKGRKGRRDGGMRKEGGKKGRSDVKKDEERKGG